MNRMPLPMLLPLVAILSVAAWGGGLGVIFILLNESQLGENAVIILGSAIAMGVPVAASLLTLPKR